MTSSEDATAKVRCSVRLQFSSADMATKVHEAVALDNEGYVETAIEGTAIDARMDASSLKSLLHTLDDFLTCVSVAEKIVAERN